MSRDDGLTGTPFVIVPVWVLRDASLSDRAIRLYGVLYGYVGEKKEAWPLQSTLSSDLNCSLASLKKALKELVDVGAVVRRPRYRDESHEIIGCWYKIVADDPKGVASPVANPSQHTGYPLASPLATELDTRELDTSKSRVRGYTPEFEAWWKIYPKPVAKPKTFGAWGATLRERGGTVESIMLATTLFAKQMIEEGRQKQHILNSDTFLGVNERWREYLPESFSAEILEQAQAWDDYDFNQDGLPAGALPEPDFPRPQDSNGNLLDGRGMAYYIDEHDFRRRYLSDE